MTFISLQQCTDARARSRAAVATFVASPIDTVLAVTGLAVEARLASGPGVTTIMAGGNPHRLRSLLYARVRPDCRAVISVGIAGGLDPILVPGDVVVATGVASAERRHPASPAMARRLAARLLSHPQRVVLADLAGVDQAVTSPGQKRALRRATGAMAVDMESHVAADFAERHGLPFAALRVVCDPAHRSLPDLIVTALGADGEVSLRNVIGSLWQRPDQVLALPRLARDAAAGLRALARCRDLLGHGFGVPEVCNSEAGAS